MDEELNTEITQPEESQIETSEVESKEPESMLDAIAEGLKPEEDSAKAEEEAKKDDAQKQEAQPEEAKTEDDETPPEGISKKAQERFQRLVSKVKEKDEELTTLRSNLDGIRKVMQDTGASPEDFSMAFDYLKAIRSGDMDQVGRILHEQIKQYQIVTGKQFGGVDPLSDFPDLRQRVDGYQMTEEAALEIARMRAVQREQQQSIQQTQQRQQSEFAVQQTREAAINEINQIGSEWAKKDPDYSAKEEIILKQIPEIARNFPPQAWAHQVRILYQALSSVPIAKPQASAPAPLRASGQSAGARQPTSMLEALQNGLGYGNG